MWYKDEAAQHPLEIPVLRWPGGCFADTYHWRDGIGPCERRPRRVNAWWSMAESPNDFGTHEFMAFNQDYKTVTSLIGDLVDIVSKNGALLLNIGPRPDGTIPEPEETMLLEIGRWLNINGEAIYGTRPWKIFGEGPTQIESGSFTDTHRAAFTSQDIRFTTRKNLLYATFLA